MSKPSAPGLQRPQRDLPPLCVGDIKALCPAIVMNLGFIEQDEKTSEAVFRMAENSFASLAPILA